MCGARGRRRGGVTAGVGVVVGVGCRRHPYASRPEPGAEPPATAGESASYRGAENASLAPLCEGSQIAL